jgi:hypothetical protein
MRASHCVRTGRCEQRGYYHSSAALLQRQLCLVEQLLALIESHVPGDAPKPWFEEVISKRRVEIGGGLGIEDVTSNLPFVILRAI